MPSSSQSVQEQRPVTGNQTGAQPAPQNEKIPGVVFMAFIAAGLLSLCGVVVETATNIAFPTLMKEFHITTDTVQWMTTIYLLTASIAMPLSANLKARFTSRSLFVTANLCFLCGLLIDIFAPIFPLMLCGRVLQGLGAGIALPLMFNIILEQVPRSKIGLMMGCGTLITAVAPAIGPTYGGLIVSNISWRYIFVFLAPIVLISLVIGWFSIKQKHETRTVHFDWIGILLIVFTFAGLIIGFSSMSSKPMLSLNVGGAIVVGVVALALFALRELHVDKPMLDMRMLRHFRFSGFVLAFFLYGICTLGMSLVLPNYLQLANGKSALVAGLCVMPGALVGAVFAPLGGRILDIAGPKLPLLTGPALSLIAIALMLIFSHSLTPLSIGGFYLLYMLGVGIANGNLMTTGLSQVGPEEQSMGNAYFNTMQQFAGATGTSVCAALLAAGQASTSDIVAGTKQGAMIVFAALVVVLVVQYIDLLCSLKLLRKQ